MITYFGVYSSEAFKILKTIGLFYYGICSEYFIQEVDNEITYESNNKDDTDKIIKIEIVDALKAESANNKEDKPNVARAQLLLSKIIAGEDKNKIISEFSKKEYDDMIGVKLNPMEIEMIKTLTQEISKSEIKYNNMIRRISLIASKKREIYENMIDKIRRGEIIPELTPFYMQKEIAAHLKKFSQK